MPSISPRAWYISKLTLLLLSLSLTVYYLFSASSIASTDYKELYKIAVNGKKSLFIESVLDSEIDGRYDNKTLIALCESTTWTPGLIFRCEVPQGGVANIRNIILNCVRYTILAGATAFVLPELLLPLPNDPKKSTPVPLSHLFDTPHFITTFTTSCPRIQIYNHINDLFDKPSTSKPAIISPASISTSPLLLSSILSNPSNWTSDFKIALNATHPKPPTAAKPILVSLKAPIMEFPLSYDDPLFISSFGRILRFREDVRRLAATVLYALSQKHSLDLSFPSKGGIQGGKFLGAHLRTGPDAKAAGWTPGEVQIGNYLSLAESSKVGTIFVSAIDPSGLQSFIDTAASQTSTGNGTKIEIETKDTLLGGELAPGTFVRPGAKGYEEEWKELRALNWDQQLLVDYEVLLRSSIFGGVWESTFSWNVMMRRHVVRWDGVWKDNIDLRRPSSDPADLNPLDRRGENAETSTSGFWGNGKHHDPSSSSSFLQNSSPNEKRAEEEKKVEIVLPPAKPEMLPSAKELELYTEEEARKRMTPTSESQMMREREVKVGDVSWGDGLSVVYGPKGEGGRVRGSLWP
ncbi:uncharacterized protein PAC_00130 [Phialocephala subalpina]|uniref:Uncharacterized protein n=1 Tax=Phialocephala subalpina TaxID=576137 RepID=A0A1L7WBU8_9HELO|nr:uncharacterized protein PAC_00130 [Phialocephala subalpina]